MVSKLMTDAFGLWKGDRTWRAASRLRGQCVPPARPRLHSRTLFACGVAVLELVSVFLIGLALLGEPLVNHLTGLSLIPTGYVAIIAAAITVTTLSTCSVYAVDRLARPGSTIAPLLAAVLAGGSGCAVALWIVHSLGWGLAALVWTLATLGVLVVGRIIVASALPAVFARGGLLCKVSVVGSGAQVAGLRAYIAARRKFGVALTSTVTPDMILRRWGSFERFCHGSGADIVVLEHERLGDLFGGLNGAPTNVLSIDPDGDGQLSPRDPLHGLPLTWVRARALSDSDLLAKAVFDRIVSAIILLFITPVLGLVALAVKLDSPGPVLFRQPRVGFNDQNFFMLKFRTMYHCQSDLLAAKQTERNDVRITRLGRLLRRLSLDELPQLINVLKGDMSLVGPRPHAPHTSIDGRVVQDLVAGYALRHRVQPGITGWAQINGARGALKSMVELESRVRLDLHYIADWSLLLDVKILVLTLWRELFSKTAY